MTLKESTLLGFDVGEKRIGVAKAVRSPGIAFPLTTLQNDAALAESLVLLMQAERPDALVVGLPRNQQGETTKQTAWVQEWTEAHLAPLHLPIAWQDESLTSVLAEEYRASGHKTDQSTDALAASVILNDYIEEHWHATK